MKNVLIVGGTSGLGLALARLFAHNANVIITGRRDPKEAGLRFIEMSLNYTTRGRGRDSDLFFRVVHDLPIIDTFVYAAGFYQEGRIDDLRNRDIEEMLEVGIGAPVMLLAELLRKQKKLDGFIAITSTSQEKPRINEPLYAGTKAGLAQVAKSVSLDERIGKVLVVGPGGMKTPFWKGSSRDTKDMLDPALVAEKILLLYKMPFEYKCVLLPRVPTREGELDTILTYPKVLETRRKSL